MDEREEEAPGEDSGLIPQIDRPMSMPYLCCKLWRWRELQVTFSKLAKLVTLYIARIVGGRRAALARLAAVVPLRTRDDQ